MKIDNKRINIQMYFLILGLNLLEVLNTLRDVEDESLQLQCDVYYEEEHEDNEQLSEDISDGLDITSHNDVFTALFNKVANTPQSSTLLSVLRGLLLIDPEDPQR